MSIFGIIGLCFLIALVPFIIGIVIMVVCDLDDFKFIKSLIINIVIAVLVWVGGVFAGIGIYTEEERVFIAKFEAQKQTIEMSLDNENLSGLERIELVKQASELNGEMAERKAKLQVWHYVTYNKSAYDNIEPISLELKIKP